jgi:hypothetical protein
MTQEAASAPAHQFTIGNVLGTSFGVLRRNIVPFGLLIPGVLIWLAYWLYVPAIVVEKRGIIESFRRSSFLTRGRRWRVVGLWLVVGVAWLLVSSGLTRVLASAMGGWSFGALYISDAAVTGFCAVATAVSYFYLRVDKEGVGIDDIAAVFD